MTGWITIIGDSNFTTHFELRRIEHSLCLKTGVLSFGVSGNDVGFPIDVIVFPAGSPNLIVKRFEEKDPSEISHLWGDKLMQTVKEIPDDGRIE